MNNLGYLYQIGLGVARDYAQARRWYQKAADAGNADGMFNLGQLYLDRLWPNDPTRPPGSLGKARQWYQKAAAAGNADAKEALSHF
jgi:TPR repeat protein